MYVLYDSVTPATIPASATAVAGYVGGFWPDYFEEVKRWPHAHHLSIAVNAGEDAECLDIESGDATADQAPPWFHRQKVRGVLLPCFYASLSPWPQLRAILEAAGIPRHEYRAWAADYTFIPHIPAGYDACQWTDRALGRNLDESLCSDTFFTTPKHVNPLDVLTEAERDLADSLLHYRKHPHFHVQGIQVTHAGLVVARKQVWVAAEKGKLPSGHATQRGWQHFNRAARYRVLWSLTRCCSWPS